MNLFNRVVASVELVALLLLFLVLALAPDVLVGGMLSDSTRSAMVYARDGLSSPLVRIGEALLTLLLAIGSFLLLVAELRPRARRSVAVSGAGSGRAELATDSVAMRVKRVAESIQGVREAVPTIRSRGKAVDISLALMTDQDIDIPQKTEEVMQAVRAETETKMGVPIKAFRVTVKHAARDGRSSNPSPSAPAKTGLFR